MDTKKYISHVVDKDNNNEKHYFKDEDARASILDISKEYIKSIDFNEKTFEITVKTEKDEVKVFDFPTDILFKNIEYNTTTKDLSLTLVNGTTKVISLLDLVKIIGDGEIQERNLDDNLKGKINTDEILYFSNEADAANAAYLAREKGQSKYFFGQLVQIYNKTLKAVELYKIVPSLIQEGGKLVKLVEEVDSDKIIFNDNLKFTEPFGVFKKAEGNKELTYEISTKGRSLNWLLTRAFGDPLAELNLDADKDYIEYLGINRFSFYDSTHPDFSYEPITENKGLAHCRSKTNPSNGVLIPQACACTKLFTKETLPVGSKIRIKTKWCFKVDKWNRNIVAQNESALRENEKFKIDSETYSKGYLTDYKQYDNTEKADNVIERVDPSIDKKNDWVYDLVPFIDGDVYYSIDESFWDGYNVCAFTIGNGDKFVYTTGGNPEILNVPTENIVDAFRVYVPKPGVTPLEWFNSNLGTSFASIDNVPDFTVRNKKNSPWEPSPTRTAEYYNSEDITKTNLKIDTKFINLEDKKYMTVDSEGKIIISDSGSEENAYYSLKNSVEEGAEEYRIYRSTNDAVKYNIQDKSVIGWKIGANAECGGNIPSSPGSNGSTVASKVFKKDEISNKSIVVFDPSKYTYKTGAELRFNCWNVDYDTKNLPTYNAVNGVAIKTAQAITIESLKNTFKDLRNDDPITEVEDINYFVFSIRCPNIYLQANCDKLNTPVDETRAAANVNALKSLNEIREVCKIYIPANEINL